MEHPITPPPELVREWRTQCSYHGNTDAITQAVACMAARWGADLELEAGLDYMQNKGFHGLAQELRAARRPKPPSLAEKGQRILVENGTTLDGRVELDPQDVSTIRRALERLQELEKGNE